MKSRSFNVSDKRKGKITARFQSTKCVPIEDTKRFLSPEKFRDFREKGPRPHGGRDEKGARTGLSLIGTLVLRPSKFHKKNNTKDGDKHREAKHFKLFDLTFRMLQHFK